MHDYSITTITQSIVADSTTYFYRIHGISTLLSKGQYSEGRGEVMAASKVVYHTIDVFPPSQQNIYWRAVCSYKEDGVPDLSRSYRTRVEALEAAHNHLNEITIRAALEKGHPFDDSTIELSPALRIVVGE
jgi:hypothetical protein